MIQIRRQRRGFTLIELLIVIAVIAILAAIALPNLLQSRIAANESSAVGSLRTINGAEATYRTRNPQYGNRAALLGANLIDPSLGSGSKSGYTIEVVPDATTPKTSYLAKAVPTSPGTSGVRQFFTDESGVLYADSDGTATLPAGSTHGAGSTGFTQVGN